MEILCYLLYELALISWICGSQFVTLNLALHPPGNVGDSRRLSYRQAVHSTERMSLDIQGPQPSTPNNHNKQSQHTGKVAKWTARHSSLLGVQFSVSNST